MKLYAETNEDGSPRGAYIAIEGCDGGDSTTQRDRLAHRLTEARIPMLSTAQPSTDAIGRLTRGARS